MHQHVAQLTALLLSMLADHTTLLAAERVMGLEMQPKMEWLGFSIRQPPDYWFFYRCEQSKTRALFHRDFVNPEHTMSFQVELKNLPKNGDLFGAAGEPAPPKQTAVLNYTEKHTTRAGRAAISYACELQDLKLSRKFKKTIVTRERGLAIVHPFLPNTIVEIVFSETAPPNEMHDAAFSQADNMINRVALDAL
jgi:hypothetical protein